MKKFKKSDSRASNSPLRGRGGPSRGGPSRGGPPHRGGGPGGQRGPAPAHSAKGPEGRPVIGIHAVTELLKVRPRSVGAFWIRETYEDHTGLQDLHDLAVDAGVKVKTQPAGLLDKITSAHQGVMAFSLEEPEVDWRAVETAEEMTMIALDEVEDPHNLGAVLRTAWLLGATAILTPEHRSAQLSPAVSKVAQGAVEHVPVVRDSALPQQLQQLKEWGFWILGLSHEAKQGLFDLEIPKKVCWVLGSESSGLRKSVLGVCDDLISIPQTAPAASYNVSVAAAVAMSETYRQRTQKPNK